MPSNPPTASDPHPAASRHVPAPPSPRRGVLVSRGPRRRVPVEESLAATDCPAAVPLHCMAAARLCSARVPRGAAPCKQTAPPSPPRRPWSSPRPDQRRRHAWDGAAPRGHQGALERGVTARRGPVRPTGTSSCPAKSTTAGLAAAPRECNTNQLSTSRSTPHPSVPRSNHRPWPGPGRACPTSYAERTRTRGRGAPGGAPGGGRGPGTRYRHVLAFQCHNATPRHALQYHYTPARAGSRLSHCPGRAVPVDSKNSNSRSTGKHWQYWKVVCIGVSRSRGAMTAPCRGQVHSHSGQPSLLVPSRHPILAAHGPRPTARPGAFPCVPPAPLSGANKGAILPRLYLAFPRLPRRCTLLPRCTSVLAACAAKRSLPAIVIPFSNVGQASRDGQIKVSPAASPGAAAGAPCRPRCSRCSGVSRRAPPRPEWQRKA